MLPVMAAREQLLFIRTSPGLSPSSRGGLLKLASPQGCPQRFGAGDGAGWDQGTVASEQPHRRPVTMSVAGTWEHYWETLHPVLETSLGAGLVVLERAIPSGVGLVAAEPVRAGAE